jgi:hypothetical protein
VDHHGTHHQVLHAWHSTHEWNLTNS